MTVNTLGKLTIARKEGTEPVHAGGDALEHTLLGFWRWSTSDLVNNATRGVLAEYLVACALGLEAGLRIEWDAYDLRMTDGTTVEVKSEAYLQSWHQERESAIGFDIRPTLGWDAATNTTALTPQRQAHVYVFALLHHRDKATVDPLDLAQWTFYVLPTAVLDARVPLQRRLSLGTLLALDPVVTDFAGLATTIATIGGHHRADRSIHEELANQADDPPVARAEQPHQEGEAARPFHVVVDEPGRVSAWSVCRLPFAPKGWRLEFREALRTRLQALVAGPDEVLHAIFTSADRASVDAENVLFYNVEAGQLAGATRAGLRFERSYAAPAPSPVALDGVATYRHEYCAAPYDKPFREWLQQRVLARWEATVPDVAALRSCAQVWHALRAVAPAELPDAFADAHFGLRIALSLPTTSTVTAATLAKPLIDGVVSAAHRHNGDDEEELAARLALQLGIGADHVRGLLRAGGHAVLGPRRVAQRFGATVQWNPRDDDCVACEIMITRDNPGPECRLVAEVIEVTPRKEEV